MIDCIHKVYVDKLSFGYVSHGDLWHNLDNLYAEKQKYYLPFIFQVKDASEGEEAFWKYMFKNKKAVFRD